MQPHITLQSNPGITIQPDSSIFSAKLGLYGFDVVAGVFYTQPQYELFFKAGALIQNLRLKVSADPQNIAASNTAIAARLNGVYSLNTTVVNALPEIRLGGNYHLYQHWLLTASWVHAFGSTLSFTAPDISGATGPILGSLGNITANVSSPTINVVLFGLEYRFM